MSHDNFSMCLARIRNASLAGHAYVALDATKANLALGHVLKQNGLILGFKVGLKPKGRTSATFGPQQKTHIKLRMQKQARTYGKILRKLRCLMLQRRKLKSKLGWIYRRLKRRVKKQSLKLRLGLVRTSKSKRRRRRLARRPRNLKPGRGHNPKSAKIKPARRNVYIQRYVDHVNKLKAKPHGNKSQTLKQVRQGSPEEHTNVSTYKRNVHRRPSKEAKRRVNLKHTKLQLMSKRHVLQRKRKLKVAETYAQGLKLNARLCFRLQQQAYALQRNLQKTSGLGSQACTPRVKKQMVMGLKYFGPYHRPALSHIQRISRPSLRLYTNCRRIPRVHMGLGLTILSTSKGLMSHLQAQKQKLGGEMILKVW